MQTYIKEQQTELQTALGSLVESCEMGVDCLTLEVAPALLVVLCERLQSEFNYSILMDLCGLDYLGYGKDNWETESASQSGFSRGVFDFEYQNAELQVPTETEANRYCVVYHLLNMKDNLRLRIKSYVPAGDMPLMPSVVPVWQCADWFEREAFDLFGIIFEGHTDLRRILTDYGFMGHPLRKDFPLTGNVEVYYDTERAQVGYRPVTIENRVNVPRVIRAD